jgi:hypothetical protein
MVSRTLLGLFALSASLAAGPPPGFHTELMHPQGRMAEWSNIVVVNDSDVAIEAYHFRTTQCSGGGEGDRDSFESLYSSPGYPGGFESMPRSQSFPIPPGGRLITQDSIPSIREHCATARVDTVLFSDGTFQGDKGIIHAMQSEREGIATAVHYWHKKLHDEHAETSYMAVVEAARAQLEKVRGRACTLPDRSTGCEFWTGVMHVDVSMSGMGIRKNKTAEENFQGYVRFVDQWQQKVDDNVAYHKLQAEFPISPKYANDAVWSK